MARRSFDRAALESGLQLMSDHIARSPLLTEHRPIQLISIGGFVSVMHLSNPQESQKFEYFLSPEAFDAQYDIVRQELRLITEQVARQLQYHYDWANDHIRLFLALLDDPQDLFDRSVEQDIVLYSDDNMIISAALWEWVLVRKMKRLQMDGQPQTSEAWRDVVTTSKVLFQRNGGPMSTEILRQFDDSDREPPVHPETIFNLRRVWRHLYRVDPFPVDIAPERRLFQYWAWSGELQTWAWINEGPDADSQSDEFPERSGIADILCIDDFTWRRVDFDAIDE